VLGEIRPAATPLVASQGPTSPDENRDQVTASDYRLMLSLTRFLPQIAHAVCASDATERYPRRSKTLCKKHAAAKLLLR
jgi:hypothetical protein